jgi:hypothetical protein
MKTSNPEDSLNNTLIGTINKVVVVTDKTSVLGFGHSELVLLGEKGGARFSYGSKNGEKIIGNGKLHANYIQPQKIDKLISNCSKNSLRGKIWYAKNILEWDENKIKTAVDKKTISKNIDLMIEDISPSQGKKMFDYAVNLSKNPGQYRLLTNNCVLQLRKILKAGFEKDNTSTYCPIKKLLKRIPIFSKPSQKVIFTKLEMEKSSNSLGQNLKTKTREI